MRSPLLVVPLAAALLAGCRADSAQTLRFASETISDRTREEVRNTSKAIVTLPEVLSSSFTDGWKAMDRTTHLYYDSTSTTK